MATNNYFNYFMVSIVAILIYVFAYLQAEGVSQG